MKQLLILILLIFGSMICYAQKEFISYDDIKYLLHNNLGKADTFLMAKGYLIAKKDNNSKNRKYAITFRGGSYGNIDLRADGKRLFIEMETNEIDQYNLIRESITQYLDKNTSVADIQVFAVKDLGNIYITVTDTNPYNPLRKIYDMHIISDKNITAYN